MISRRVWHAADVRVPPPARDLALAVLSEWPLTGMEEGPEESGALAIFSELPIDAERLRSELAAIIPPPAAIRVRTFTVEEEDWLAAWKAGWTPTPLGRRLVVVPAWWDGALPPGRLQVRLDPGLAFGTGTHETTALAWELLEEAIEEGGGRRMLDVGSGTGVLAIGATLLDARVRVLATERDALALPTLEDAIRANGAAGRVLAVRAAAVPAPAGSIDLAVANLTAAEHRVVDGELARVLAPRATLVLSGFLHPQIEEALARWGERGFGPPVLRRRGEWSAARLRRGRE